MRYREGPLTAISSSHAFSLFATGYNRGFSWRSRGYVWILHDDYAPRPYQRSGWNRIVLRTRRNLRAGLFRFMRSRSNCLPGQHLRGAGRRTWATLRCLRSSR
jgi:hypothetical protein